jgi:hypothetical protein
MSQNKIAKPTPTSGWRITTSHVEREEQATICSSSNSSLSIWLNPFDHGWTIYRETPSTVGMTYGRSSLATSRAHTCVLATLRIQKPPWSCLTSQPDTPRARRLSGLLSHWLPRVQPPTVNTPQLMKSKIPHSTCSSPLVKVSV